MEIADYQIAGKELTLREADHLLQDLGFTRGAWDYEHATYDYKFEHLGDTYYLRIHAEAVKGALENPEAVLRFHEPFMGKATFPHGVDYEADIPSQIMDNAKKKLTKLVEQIES